MENSNFQCEKCGACCRYHKCRYLTGDSLCAIYPTRPDRCNVDKMYRTGMNREEYYKMVKLCCNLLRTKEQLDRLVETFYDPVFEQERENFRRKDA